LEDLKERERQLLEKKSQVLRLYLLENVVPILSQGILEVCQKLPDDPVDYLADFLFERSAQVPFKDPSKYNH
jgi:adenylate kinase